MALIGEFEAAVRDEADERELDQFRLCGELFTVDPGDMTIPLARFARIAAAGTEAEQMEGLAAMLDLLEAVVIPEDRPRLVKVAAAHKIDAELLMTVVSAVIAAETARPTVSASGFSPGQSTTGVNSMVSPFGRVSPILLDPRVQELVPVEEAGMRLVV